jgi:hypothetical protein
VTPDFGGLVVSFYVLIGTLAVALALLIYVLA